MKVLLIDPLGDLESTGLNIGLAYCATVARKRGHVVSVMDLVNIRKPDPCAAIKNAIEVFAPDAVGLSVCNMSLNNVRLYTESIKKYFDGKIIIGGPEISVLGKRSLEMISHADIAVIGEGEVTFTELLDALSGRSDLSAVNGIVVRSGDGIRANAPRDFITALDSMDFPDYGVFGIDKMDVYPIVTTRGCPFGCSFCFSYLGRKWRVRSPENVVKELRAAKERYGFKLFQICDPAFNVDIARVERFCDLLIEAQLNTPWVIQGFRADTVTERMMQRLSAAGCRRVFVGIESLEEDVFSRINKGETLERIKQSIAMMRKYDIEVFGHLLMGLPGDTLKKTLRSFEKARKLDLNLVAYASCVPFTGTAVERWVKNNAVVVSDSYNISSLGTKYGCIAFHTEDFTLEERIKARRILNIKSGSYNEPGTNPMLLKLKKLLLIIRYDLPYLPKRLTRSILYRLNYKKTVDSINLWRGVRYFRLPDGTWGLGKEGFGPNSQNKRFCLDMKRLTVSEVAMEEGR